MPSGIAYKGFKSTNKVIAIYNPKNTPLIDPISFMIGQIRLAQKADIKDLIRNWQTAHGSDDYSSPFEEGNMKWKLRSGETLVRQIIDAAIDDKITVNDVFDKLEKLAMARHKTYNLTRVGGEEVFSDWKTEHGGPEREGYQYAGQIWLSGLVRQDGVQWTRKRGSGFFPKAEIFAGSSVTCP